MNKQVKEIKIYGAESKPEDIALIDNEDFERVNKHKWYMHKGYAITTIYCGNYKYKTMGMHRFIMNTPEGMYTDHINCNKLDNRKCNLRICTNSQNLLRSTKPRGKNKYKGISWKTRDKRWEASIFVNGKYIQIGHFKELEDAVEAYNKKAFELLGEYAGIADSSF